MLVNKVDFSKAIHYKKDGWSYNYRDYMCAFFIKKLDINCSKEIYNQLICYDLFDECSVDFKGLNWIETKLGSKEMKKLLEYYINNNYLANFLLSNRVEYCIEKEWDICLPFIISQLKQFEKMDTSFYYLLIKYMSKFNHLEDLFNFYEEYNIDFKLKLIDASIEENNFSIVEYAEKDIRLDNENSIDIAEKLLSLKSKMALDYYIDWIKNNKKFNNYDDFDPPQINYDNTDVVDNLIELIDLTFKYDYSFLRSNIHKTLTKISMTSSENVKIIIEKLKIYIENSSTENINYENCFIDQLISGFIMQSNII